MEKEHDIKSYLANSKIKENVSSALDQVLQQPVLPYNPYTSLLNSFLKNSEYYVIAKSHLQLGAKCLKTSEVTRLGTLYKSTSDIEPPIWGLQNVLKWVNASKIAEKVKIGIESVAIPDDLKYAVSLVAPSSFHKSILGNVHNEVNLHIDIVCTDDSIGEVVLKCARAIETDFLLQDRNGCVPLILQISGTRPALFTAKNFDSGLFQDVLQSSTKVQSFQMFNIAGEFLRVSKSFTIYRVWKKLGKLFSSSIGTSPLLNLMNGVLITSAGAVLYEDTLLQSTLIDQEAIATRVTHNPGPKNVSVLLSLKHPSVIISAAAVRDEFLATSANIDILRYAQGLLWHYFLSANDSTDTGILQDIFSLHRSTAAKFYSLSQQYKALETYFVHSKEDPSDILKSVSQVLGNISTLLNSISYKSSCAPVQKWYAQVLENNVYILEGMIHDKTQYNNIPEILGVEKVSCRVAALFFLPHVLGNLECLSAELEKSRSLSQLRLDENAPSEIPQPDVELGFYELSMNKPHEFGVDLVKNAAKIQSAANMHTIAVLLQYQSDMYIDTTLENVINSISSDFPANPYREFVTECLLSSHRVDTGCIPESSIIQLLRHKPKIKSAEHQIFCIEGSIFGLHHSVLQVDPDGLHFILSVCKTVQNNPFITKKDGVRIMHTTFPCADYLICGRLRPMIFTIRCEEYYVMIKETKAATAEIGLNFLTEMIYLHLVDISKTHIVVGYSVDEDDVILLNMNKIQARPSEKSVLVSELREVIEERSQLSVQYFVKTDLGHYVKVIKDIKPIYADQSAELYDHYTPCNALNANFAVFSKLYPANFFYDYAEGKSDEDLGFVLDHLNRTIVEQSENWSVYQTIQLKHMLREDDSFLASAFHIAHSTCSRLRGLQELNETVSDVMSLGSRTGAYVDTEIVKEMVIDLATHSKETLDNIGAGELLGRYVDSFLKNIYNGGDPVLDEKLERSLKSLFIIFSSLAQYFEKEFSNSSSYKLQSFVAEAAAELKLSR